MRILATLVLLSTTSGCIGFNTADGEPNNIVAGAAMAYASLAGEGIGVIDPATGTILARIAPPGDSCRVDDLAIDGELLFAMDGEDGALSVLSISDPAAPVLVSGPVDVDVGPFSGVAAAAGLVVVSGGTSDLMVLGYDGAGSLGSARGVLDLDRGQPDVSLSADGTVAYISTHFSDDVDGAEFGITALLLGTPPSAPTVGSRVGIAGAGFTGGTANPANFPIETAVLGDTLYVAFGRGLALVDVSNPLAIKLISVLPLDIEGTSVDAMGDRAYLVGIEPSPTLIGVDIADPLAPFVIETVPLSEDALPTGVALTASRVLVAANHAGIIGRDR